MLLLGIFLFGVSLNPSCHRPHPFHWTAFTDTELQWNPVLVYLMCLLKLDAVDYTEATVD